MPSESIRKAINFAFESKFYRKMKRLLLLFAFAAANLVNAPLWAQDTTNLRMISFSDGGELVLFNSDTSTMYYSGFNTNASFNAIFHHPATGDLYCLHDTVATTGRRDFYKIDPFSGAMTFVYSPTRTFLAAACVGPNGMVYAISGNGGGGPGQIYAIDMFNGTESLFTTTDMTFGGNFQVGANITYYPPTNELWLFGGSADSLIKINVTTLAETRVAAFLNADAALKATYLEGNTFWLASDLAYTFDALTADSIKSSTFAVPDYLTDLEMLDLIKGSDTIGICSGDSATLISRFAPDSYAWYLNGAPLGLTTSSINVATAGTYRLLIHSDNGYDMWSEEVEVVAGTTPIAGFAQSVDTVQVGVAVNFQDLSGGGTAYTWTFGDGNSSNLSNPSHAYTTVGTYPVMQIVGSGPCTDTAYGQVVVIPLVGIDPGQGDLAISEFTCSPNPANAKTTIDVSTGIPMQISVEVYNLLGKRVALLHDGILEAGIHHWNWSLDGQNGQPVAAGLYFVKLTGENGVMSRRVVVSR